MRNEPLFVFAATLLAMLLLASCSGADPVIMPSTSTPQSTIVPASGEAIKIAGGFALTGDGSLLDLPAANGAKLALKEINAAGGVLGRPLELVVRDSEYKMNVVARIAQQFVEQDKVVSGIGFDDTNSMLAAGPAFQKAGLPFITVGATSPKIPQQVGDMIYLACFGDNTQAAAGAEYATENFGKNAYLLWDRDVEYTTLLAGYFRSSFTEPDGCILLEDSYADNATDFSAQIARLKSLPKQPDFYYISAMPYNAGLIVKQFRDAGLTGPIVGGDGYDTPDIVSIAGNDSDNVFFSTHALMDAQKGTERIRRFIAAYNKEYGHDPENAFAALGYDTMHLMADAIKRADSTNPQAIQKAIQDTKDFPGITGDISYPGGVHVPQKMVTIIAVKDGKFTLGGELMPEKVPAP